MEAALFLFFSGFHCASFCQSASRVLLRYISILWWLHLHDESWLLPPAMACSRSYFSTIEQHLIDSVAFNSGYPPWSSSIPIDDQGRSGSCIDCHVRRISHDAFYLDRFEEKNFCSTERIKTVMLPSRFQFQGTFEGIASHHRRSHYFQFQFRYFIALRT